MLPETRMDTATPTTSDDRLPVAQGEPPPAPPPPAPAPDTTAGATATAARREAPSPAAPPAPPPSGIVVRVQRMPANWRWALGLGLAFLAGFGFWFSPLFGIGAPVNSYAPLAVAAVLALVAGFLLSSWRWWAALALADAGVVGGLVASWVTTQVDSSRTVGGGALGQTLYGLSWFMLLGMAPLIVLVLVGIGLGTSGGMTRVPPHAFSTGAGRVGRWVAVFVPVFIAGLLASGAPTIDGPVSRNTAGLAVAILLALPCFMAGWLLHSWWGAVAAPVIYTAIATGVAELMVSASKSVGTVSAFNIVVYLIVPAVVMSAIGTAIGMYRARRAGQPPQAGQAAPA